MSSTPYNVLEEGEQTPAMSYLISPNESLSDAMKRDNQQRSKGQGRQVMGEQKQRQTLNDPFLKEVLLPTPPPSSNSNANSPPSTTQNTTHPSPPLSQRSRSTSPQRPLPPSTVPFFYTDTYSTSKNLSYIYPSSYTFLQPSTFLLRLSLALFLLSTYVCVHIVCKCAYEFEQTFGQRMMEDNGSGDNGDGSGDNGSNGSGSSGSGDTTSSNTINYDNYTALELGFCSSHKIYAGYITSSIFVLLSLSYLSLAGYVKLRDYVVANARSQLGGGWERSDYYSKRNEGEGGKMWQSDGEPKWEGRRVMEPSEAAIGVNHR
ncbi:hypothetical protein TrLO_g4285 [Triparma laevis f. longispina]|uniref:Uncharacterized protein n=1 Tax=Triparma laevis f. longispina TaxID=1714387 RepID=A0A9W7DVQ8_9STRA|nr:hypothetical protein TrLO_g4285 [Triparma laevis f. longispina]